MPQNDGQPIPKLGRKLFDLKNHGEDDPSELLKYRFLCREGILGVYGQTGIGKSSLSMQCIILWAIGKPAFGIVPRQPLKSLLIQAENDDVDLTEMRDGICERSNLSGEERQIARENIIVIQEDSRVSTDFINCTVKAALEFNKPDLLWIDCALSYLGGDSISQEIVGRFLRNDLKPLLKSNSCGCIIIHHTNKTGNNDSAYSGSGSAEWGNMPRAILVLSRNSNGTFELTAAKRGSRLRWKMSDGKTPTLVKLLKHSSIERIIHWEETDSPPGDSLKKSVQKRDFEEEILKRVPQVGKISKDELVMQVNKETGIGVNRIGPLINVLIGKDKLSIIEVARVNARAAIYLARAPAKADIPAPP